MNNPSIVGKAWTFGDNIDTGYIMPATYASFPDEKLADHAMEGVAVSYTHLTLPTNREV